MLTRLKANRAKNHIQSIVKKHVKTANEANRANRVKQRIAHTVNTG